MTPEELSELKTLLHQLTLYVDKIQTEDGYRSDLLTLNRSILKLAFVHKDAFTLKEVSERTSIPLKTIYRYVDEGKLKVIDAPGIKTLVTHEEILNFLNKLRNE